MKRLGPSLRIVASCSDCEHETSVEYAVQGDSGFHRYCTEPSIFGAGGRRYLGGYDSTPTWCPLLAAASAALKESL